MLLLSHHRNRGGAPADSRKWSESTRAIENSEQLLCLLTPAYVGPHQAGGVDTINPIISRLA